MGDDNQFVIATGAKQMLASCTPHLIEARQRYFDFLYEEPADPRELRGWPQHSQCTPCEAQRGNGWTKGPPPICVRKERIPEPGIGGGHA